MSASQFEDGEIVVECRWFPTVGRMTETTVCSKLRLMGIILQVTGSAGRWRSFEFAVCVAELAFDRGVHPGQLEICQVVVEFSRFPTVGGVARLTSRAKSSFMLIGMTADALDGGVF